jgi:MFS superfamily sulfate permease-like transporter
MFKHLTNDLPAGLVVFLVALPLCLGIALASGAPLFSGIIAGIIGGIVVGSLSGSPLGVSGPAAGLIAIVLPAIADFGFEIFLVAVVISGVIQVILGYLKAGIIGYYFPSAVIRGMLSAIGVIIVLKQIPHAFGYDEDYEGDLSFVQPDGHTTFSELYYMLDYISPSAIIITLVSMGILILWEQDFIRKKRIFQVVQGPLIVVVVGILLKMGFDAMPAMKLDANHLVALPVVSTFNGLSKLYTLPDLAGFLEPEIYLIGLTMAVVASLETLLCVEATDRLDPLKRITPTNQELKAQGVGNILSGFIGGLPITQVIVRSSANIQSGGRTKTSAIFHGILLLVSALTIPLLLNHIPLASLASILFMVGYKLAKPAVFKEMFGHGMDQFIPFMVTVVAIVFTDLLVGILIGLAVGTAFVIRSNYHSAFTIVQHDEQTLIRFNKDVNFIHKSEIIKALNSVPSNSKLIIDGAKAWYIDHDVFEMIQDFRYTAKERKIDLEIIHFNNRKAAQKK